MKTCTRQCSARTACWRAACARTRRAGPSCSRPTPATPTRPAATRASPTTSWPARAWRTSLSTMQVLTDTETHPSALTAGSDVAIPHSSSSGIIRTLTPLDRESVPHYWLTLCAEDHGLVPRHSCVQVFIEVLDVNDMVPWPERAAYAAAVPEHCAAGTHVATVRAHDADAAASPANITYSIVAGNPDGLFSIDERTGTYYSFGS